MKKYLSLLVALAVTLFSFSSFAFTPPTKPADGWYVLDQAGKLSSDQVSQLNQKIESLNKTTKNEYAVAILSTLDGGNIEDAAQATFRSWGVGKKGLNNGVLLMISVGDRKTRIQTGKGAEGDLPDLFCSDVLANTLRPRLKAGQWYAGVNDTIDALAGHMESRAKGSDSKTDSSTPVTTSHGSGCDVSPTGPGTGTLFALLLVGLGGLGLYLRRRSNKAQEAQVWLDEQNAEWEKSLRSAQRVRDEQRALDMARQRDKELEAARTFVPKAVPLPLPVHMTRAVPPPVVLSSGAPRIPRPEGVPTAPVARSSGLSTTEKVGLGVAGVAVAALAADALLEQSRRRREEEEEETRRAARRRREEEEENDRRRRQREDDDRRSSSSSSYDSGSSSSSWDSGGSGFGGGDSGGGGSSGDF